MCPAERQGACLAAAAAELEAPQRLSLPNPCRVLIVDDDDLVRARLSALLHGLELRHRKPPPRARKPCASWVRRIVISC